MRVGVGPLPFATYEFAQAQLDVMGLYTEVPSGHPLDGQAQSAKLSLGSVLKTESNPASGLSPGTTYGFQVQARDTSPAQNVTALSSPLASATTDAASVHVVGLIGYSTVGGKSKDKHLLITATLQNGADAPVGGASVSIMVTGPLTANLTGTTDVVGEVIFKLTQAPSGSYTAAVTDVTVTGFTWDGTTGESSYDTL